MKMIKMIMTSMPLIIMPVRKVIPLMREELLDGDCITAGWGTHSLGSLIPGRSIIITDTMISTMIMACLGYVQLCRLLQKVAAPLMERADCEERLEACQGPRPLGCPPLAVRIFFEDIGHGPVGNFSTCYVHICSCKFPCRKMHFVLEEMWQQAPALDTSGPTLADLLLAMDFSRAW